MTLDAQTWEGQLALPQGALQPLQAQLTALPEPEELVRLLEPVLRLAEADPRWLQPPAVQQALARMAYAAPFLVRRLAQRGERLSAGLLADLEQPAALRPWSDYVAPGALAGMEEDAVLRALRQWKYDTYARVTAQELLGLHSAQVTCRVISDLADAVVRVALAWGFGRQVARLGLPLRADGGLVAPVVIGMGKLGGQELNYASDVDLIFLQTGGAKTCRVDEAPPPDYAPDGDDGAWWAAWHERARAATQNPLGDGDPSGFHDRVARSIIRLLSTNTVDGIGFRVDADLRPLGRTAALVPTLTVAEDYYQHQGREWERTAMVKARPIAGDPALGASFMDMIRPFTYRRYLDYSALEGIAIVKHDIDRAQGGESQRNLKLGRGGIRENEFFVQAQQLIYGGREPDLRVTGHDAALGALQDAGLLSPEETAAHRAAYWHLRGVENRVQMVEEAQTHELPEAPDALQRVLHDFAPDFPARLPAVLEGLDAVRTEIAQRFSLLCQGMGHGDLPEVSAWHEAVLQRLPPEEAEPLLKRIDALFARLMTTRMGERCVFKLGRLLTQDELYQAGSEPGFARWVAFFEQIGNRNALYVLMDAHPPIVAWAAEIFREAGRHAELVIRHPELLETYFGLSEGPAALAAPFRETAERAQDEEEFLLEMQRAKLHGTVRILTHYLAQPEADTHSDLLSTMADEAVNACLRYTWRQMVARMGAPEGASAEEVRGFSVLAMGRWGSREMRFASDLDLVFLCGPEGRTDRDRSHTEFYTKVAQKLTALLTAPTQFGRLYELDHRLRPFGNKGVLVPSLQAYRNFLENEADVWNYQAFTRLRPVGGDAALSAELVAEIGRTWRVREDAPGAVAKAVWEMLHRLISANPAGEQGLPLKYTLGGMLGYEFYAQLHHLLEARHSGAWTPPAPDGILTARYDDYQTLSALDERLSFYLSPFVHVVQPEQFKQLRAIGARWRFAEVQALVRRMDESLQAAFTGAMAD